MLSVPQHAPLSTMSVRVRVTVRVRFRIDSSVRVNAAPTSGQARAEGLLSHVFLIPGLSEIL